MEEHMTAKVFRCPFELKGEKEGTIITVQLSEMQSERFATLRSAFERLHRDRTRMAIRLVLPVSLQRSCANLVELRERLLPYQAEVIAADFDDQLFPYLPHQANERKLLESFLGRLPFDKTTALRLCDEFGEHPPRSLVDFAGWLLAHFRDEKGVVTLGDASGALMAFDSTGVSIGGESQKSTFSIVKAPFYPKNFGRYSERIEMVINRQVDVANLPQEVARRIRRQANEVYASHGVRIPDLDATQQPSGVWIPGESYEIVQG